MLNNFHNPVIDVKHAELPPSDEDSIFRRKCPVCTEGVLLVGRDLASLVLKEDDICIACGQRIRYTDIVTMRQNDWSKGIK